MSLIRFLYHSQAVFIIAFYTKSIFILFYVPQWSDSNKFGST